MSTIFFAQDDLSALNDEFTDASTLANWQTFHESERWVNHVLKADINTSSPNQFHLEPQTGFWFGEVHAGPFFYKTVSGDFTVTTKLKVTGRKTDLPEKYFSLAGLMIRSPRSKAVDKEQKGHENWLFLCTGFANDKGKNKREPQFETKVTRKSKSKLQIFPAKNDWIELAITRVGHQFIQSYKYQDGDWQILRVINHSEMNQTLQVGLLAYTDFNNRMKRRYIFSRKKLNTTVYTDGNPDLIARFDYVHFTRPNTKAKELLSNNSSFSNELLTTLNLD